MFSLHFKNEKVTIWEEVFSPLNYSHLCSSSDYANLPQNLFGMKGGNISSDKIRLPQGEPESLERDQSNRQRNRAD